MVREPDIYQGDTKVGANISEDHEVSQWIVGDEFYGPQEDLLSERLMLHAQSLAFFHPRTNEWMRFKELSVF